MVYCLLCVCVDVITNSERMTIDRLESLRTLAFSDNINLQKSAALCFSEISDTCT